MTATVATVNTASDTWQVLVDRVNHLSNLASNAMVTVSTSPTGSVSTGNAHVNGHFYANTLATAGLRGGTVDQSNTLVVTSNVTVGEITFYTNGYVNAEVYQVGGNVSLSQSGLTVGNTVVNSTAVVIGGVVAPTANNRAAGTEDNGTTLARGRFNFIQGDNVLITVSDDEAGNQVNVTISSVGGDTGPGVAGSNGQIQFNNSDVLAGDSGLTYNRLANNLSVANTVFANTVGLDSGAVAVSHVTKVTSGTTAQLVDTWSGGTYRTAFYQASIKNNSANGYAATQLTLVFDGSDTHLMEAGMITTNASLGVWSANVNVGTVRLYYTPIPSAAVIRAQRTLIVV